MIITLHSSSTKANKLNSADQLKQKPTLPNRADLSLTPHSWHLSMAALPSLVHIITTYQYYFACANSNHYKDCYVCWRNSSQMKPDPDVCPSSAPTHAICFLKYYKINNFFTVIKNTDYKHLYVITLIRWGKIGWLSTAATYFPNSSDQQRPPSRWRCAPTLRFRATWLLSKRLSPTPESSMSRCQATWLSPFNPGLPQDKSFRHLYKTATNPDTMSFPSFRSPQKRHWHAFTSNMQSQIRSLFDSARRIPQHFCHKTHQCRHNRHQ